MTIKLIFHNKKQYEIKMSIFENNDYFLNIKVLIACITLCDIKKDRIVQAEVVDRIVQAEVVDRIAVDAIVHTKKYNEFHTGTGSITY